MQSALFVRAMFQDADLILLDEPRSGTTFPHTLPLAPERIAFEAIRDLLTPQTSKWSIK